MNLHLNLSTFHVEIVYSNEIWVDELKHCEDGNILFNILYLDSPQQTNTLYNS
jgi:hypothetical protein